MAAINHPQGGRFKGLNKPKMTPDHPKYAAAVVTKVDGKEKLLRFGLQGAKRFPKREGESKAAAERLAAMQLEVQAQQRQLTEAAAQLELASGRQRNAERTLEEELQAQV